MLLLLAVALLMPSALTLAAECYDSSRAQVNDSMS
jgi:hypothetical protein